LVLLFNVQCKINKKWIRRAANWNQHLFISTSEVHSRYTIIFFLAIIIWQTLLLLKYV